MVGRVLAGRYEVLDRIGQGGMALVYRARDLALNRFVAVKVLKDQWVQDEDVVNRFLMEARAAASLDGRHIVQVYDVGVDDDERYIVMELVNGPNLKDYLAAHGPLDPALALDIADQVARALGEAHEQQVIHRDIKPQNILVAEDGTVKVTDFGIARAMTSSTLVNTGSVLGTAQYLSPEQARGKRVGPATDLYGLGVVLFEMLTGSPPYSGDSALAVALQHMQEPPPDVRSLRPDVPEPVARLTARLLAKDADDRFSSAAAFQQRVAEIRRGGGKDPIPLPDKSPERRRDRRPGRTFMTPARRRWTIAAATALVLLTALGYGLERWISGPTPVAVARVVGDPVARARRVLRQQGFKVVVSGHHPTSRYGAGQVIRESPPAGTKLKPGGGVVRLLLSSGPSKIPVPFVVYLSANTATTQLKHLGLHPVVKHVHSTQPADEVIHQTPAEGTLVKPGATITLDVSRGPATAAANIPNVTGLATSTASAELGGVGMTLGPVSYQYSTQPSSTIIDQDPAPYGKALSNGSESVVLSRGPSPQSSSMTLNNSNINITVANNAPSRSVLKVVVQDQAGNEEIFWSQVTPGQTVPISVEWYGQNGQLVEYLNGTQVGAPVPLTPNSSSSASSSPNGGSPSGNG